jgi:exonuclease VII small subunit
MFEKADHIMATYVDAAEEFGRSAKEFQQHVKLLPQAWNAYQQAMTASAELRAVLDNADETLRVLMNQLEQALSAPFGKPGLAGREPETVKAEAMKASAGSLGGGGIGVVKTLP